MIPRLQDSARHRSAGRAAAQLLVSFLALSTTPAASGRNTQEVLSPILDPLIPQNPTGPAQHTFTLRHIFHHGADLYPKLHRKKDIKNPKETVLWLAAEDEHDALQLPPLIARSQPIKIERMVDRRPSVVDPMVAAARKGGYVRSMAPSAWNLDDVQGPDVTDKDTVLSMAYMCSNAYARDGEDPDWHEVGGPFNNSADFGWEGDGLRGHIWADENNSTIVIGLKGTSPAYFDGKETTTNDKVNDNLFFGCCCGQQGAWTYRQVCDCATGTYTCNNTCVRSALQEENRYYTAARELYSNVTELYPNSNIWVAGHSLGGAVSSLLGLTYGLPVVTFEAVPEALPASRLGLPVPPSADPNFPQERQYTGTYHFGHTADPIYIGTCSGSTASCSYFGYALESACHTGYECTYDVVADKGWRVGIGTHQIRSVIRDVILQYDTVPECKPTPECRDCHKWKFYWSNGSEITTTSSTSPTSTMTRTRTSTCKTPGWWGCLDEDTTTGTETATTSTSTSTCQTPGWFGCKDKTTTTTTTTSETTTTTTTTSETTTTTTTTSETTTTTVTTTCETPGWWGCNDKTTAETGTTGTLTTEPTVEPTITSPPTLTSELPTPTTTTTTSASRCLHRNWYGRCTRWEGDGPEPEPEPPADPPVNNARPDEI